VGEYSSRKELAQGKKRLGENREMASPEVKERHSLKGGDPLFKGEDEVEIDELVTLHRQCHNQCER